MLHCDLRLRWKVASDLRFRAAISEPKTPSFCGSSGDLAPSTRKSLAIAIVRFWCAKLGDKGPLGQDFHFLLRNPRTPEGFQKGSLKGSLKGSEGFQKGSLEGSLKGFRRVLG